MNVDSWSPLQEVWLGDCYPSKFYDHLSPDVRDCFYEITEITKHDLKIIERKLNDLGVVVQRPLYERVDDYINNGNLEKPHITPRDFYFCHNDNFYFNDDFDGGKPWNHVIANYRSNKTVNIKDRFLNGIQINGSNVVRVGKDVYFDMAYDQSIIAVPFTRGWKGDDKKMLIEIFNKHVKPSFNNFRCHMLFNGGHIDGCFAILRPGLILTSSYFSEYETTFPGWEVINLNGPEFENWAYGKIIGNHEDKNWYAPNLKNNNSFNDHIVKHALDWVGTFTETYFNINCLVVDTKNVLMLGENDKLFNYLSKKGINVHSVPFRTRTFWDGGVHCLTVDIKRNGKVEDYFKIAKDYT